MNFFDDEESAQIDDKGKKLIENARKAISLDKTITNRNDIIENAMDAIYNHFATYSEKELNKFNLQLELFEFESLLEDEFLPLASEPIYNESSNPEFPKKIESEPDAEQAMDYLVHHTRKKLAKFNDLKTSTLSKQCFDTSYNFEEICQENNINTIHFGVNQNLSNGMFHHFSIARFPLSDGTYKQYLVDCTYRQFFTKAKSNPKRIGVMRGPAKGCSIGSYMMMTPERKEIAETILQKGYIEATPEVLKEYFDAIIYSGRDKSFYDENGLDYLNQDDVVPKFALKEYLEKLTKNSAATYSKTIDETVDEILASNLILGKEDLKRVNISNDSRGDSHESK